MTYVVTESCIKCKFMDCLGLCPVDCFYEGENMLVINPEECIDCGVCELECPTNAIKSDKVEGNDFWLQLNAEFSKVWPNINMKGVPPSDGKEWDGVPDKYATLFSPNPAPIG
jgi:ferredoxin